MRGYFPPQDRKSSSLSAQHAGSVIEVKVVICPYDSLPSPYPEQGEKGKRENDHASPETLSVYYDDGGDDDDGPPLSSW